MDWLQDQADPSPWVSAQAWRVPRLVPAQRGAVHSREPQVKNHLLENWTCINNFNNYFTIEGPSWETHARKHISAAFLKFCGSSAVGYISIHVQLNLGMSLALEQQSQYAVSLQVSPLDVWDGQVLDWQLPQFEEDSRNWDVDATPLRQRISQPRPGLKARLSKQVSPHHLKNHRTKLVVPE